MGKEAKELGNLKMAQNIETPRYILTRSKASDLISRKFRCWISKRW